MPEMIAKRYMVVQPLGEGGMADVYLAVDTLLNREVAIKMLRGELSGDPVALLRFQREANAASALNHPNIVELYDVGEENGKHYIVMEYVRGKTLKQLIQQRGAMEKNEAIAIMDQLISAVIVAHKSNIIHRDIKPQNVLVKDDGTVKITDFGIAVASDAIQLTQTDTIMGSVHYLAPELARGENASQQSDIYALGIVFYELLTGQVPHKGEAPVQIAIKHMRDEIPSVLDFNPTLPQSMDNIIIRATAKNKAYRYKMAQDMLEDLHHCTDDKMVNADKLVFDSNIDDGATIMIGEVAKMEQPGKKKRNYLAAFIGVGLIVLSIIMIVSLMALSGTFDPKSKIVKIPDITSMTVADAKVELAKYNLSVSSTINYQLTDDVDEGLIISYTPTLGTEVEKGSTVILTVSEGKYFIVGDYKGMLADDVRALLTGKKITIRTQDEPNATLAAGTVIRQELLMNGDKLDPTRQYELKLIVASNVSFIIPSTITNMEITSAKALLESMATGIKVTLVELPTDGMSEGEIKKLVTGVVISSTPNAGSYYTQTSTSDIKLCYYK